MARRMQVEMSGPFFRQRDPRATCRQNIRAMMDELAEAGEADVKSRIAAIPPRGVRTGATREAVVGRTQSLRGKRWAVTAVVSVNTNGMAKAEAIHYKAAGSEIERKHHPFRRAATSLRKTIRTDLAKGLD